MRILLLANNWVGLQIAKYLKERNEQIVGLGIHAPDRQKYTADIIKAVSLPNHLVFEGNVVNEPKTIEKIKEMKPDITLAAFWYYILGKELLHLPRYGCINFHPGFLPYNRGMNPNVWPFIEDSPAGVTLHYMTEKVDKGDIIAQKQIPIEADDTAGSLEKKTWIEIVALFKKTWPKIKKQQVKSIPQDDAKATVHTAKDIFTVDEIYLDKNYTGKELLNRLRSRSYPKHFFAYYKVNGEKIFIKAVLTSE